MKQKLHRYVARVALFVLLGTFLSPAVGWHMIAAHGELEQTSLGSPAHDHDHEADPLSGHSDDDAHALFGHLLTHMPLQVMAESVLPIVATQSHVAAQYPSSLASILLERPFHPPR